jgi:hypothetical protein
MSTPAAKFTAPREPDVPGPPVPELTALRQDRTGDTWVARHVSRNGVVCVSWQQICLGISHAGSQVDIHVDDDLLQIWSGPELIKTVKRTSRGEVRKKNASTQATHT